MKTEPFPSGQKPQPGFARVQGKTETFLFTTEKYKVEFAWSSSTFNGPDFFSADVSDLNGKSIWDSRADVFLDTIFSSDFISDRFDKMVLIRVNNTNRSDSMQVILVDLKNGSSQTLTEEGFYSVAGHFLSFDGVFWSEKKEVRCFDFETQTEFFLFEILKKEFADIKTWAPAPVAGCILIVTAESENNMVLFDLRKKEIRERTTIQFKEMEFVHPRFERLQSGDTAVLSVSYANKAANGYPAHAGTDYFSIRF
jgi:hypothetical protein